MQGAFIPRNEDNSQDRIFSLVFYWLLENKKNSNEDGTVKSSRCKARKA